jgi:[histone H4]-N-methyl-L-lysine20 N-methyltransferase
VERLKTEREKEDFKRHMRKYVNIWQTDCPWEVKTTNRYTVVMHEAAAAARRFIKRGETIKYLTGNLVAMTAEEEKELSLSRRDFSIVMSTRKKTPSIFLGPARFANHDCDANARLVTTGSEGMQVVAVRDIAMDEEITVTYGEDYFGIDNCECLCRTCELALRNGWSQGSAESEPAAATPGEDDRQAERPYSFRKRRRFLLERGSASTTPEADERPSKRRRSLPVPEPSPAPQETPKRRRGRPPKTRPGSEPASAGTLAGGEDVQIARRRKGFMQHGESVESQPIIIPSREDPKAAIALPPDSPRPSTLSAEETPAPTPLTPRRGYGRTRSKLSVCENTDDPVDASQASSTGSDIDSVFDANAPAGSSRISTPASSLASRSKPFEREPSDQPGPRIKVEPPSPDGDPALSESDLSSLSSDEDFDDATQTIVRRPRSRSPGPSPPAGGDDPAGPAPPRRRRPGDYVGVASLLSEPYSRWVDCQTCADTWVQPNGYYTRKECPRCERHSKLYGYQWPQTDPVRGEAVGRVLDHRTVHRFLGPEDEARVRRREPSWEEGGAMGRRSVEGDGGR